MQVELRYVLLKIYVALVLQCWVSKVYQGQINLADAQPVLWVFFRGSAQVNFPFVNNPMESQLLL